MNFLTQLFIWYPVITIIVFLLFTGSIVMLVRQTNFSSKMSNKNEKRDIKFFIFPIITTIVLSAFLGYQLDLYYSSFEGKIIEKYVRERKAIRVTSARHYVKVDTSNELYTTEVPGTQYQKIQVGDHIKKESKTFEIQINLSPDNIEKTQ